MVVVVVATICAIHTVPTHVFRGATTERSRTFYLYKTNFQIHFCRIVLCPCVQKGRVNSSFKLI